MTVRLPRECTTQELAEILIREITKNIPKSDGQATLIEVVRELEVRAKRNP